MCGSGHLACPLALSVWWQMSQLVDFMRCQAGRLFTQQGCRGRLHSLSFNETLVFEIIRRVVILHVTARKNAVARQGFRKRTEGATASIEVFYLVIDEGITWMFIPSV